MNTSIRNIIMKTPSLMGDDIIFIETEVLKTISEKKQNHCNYCKMKFPKDDFICTKCNSINPNSDSYPVNFSKYQIKQYKYFLKLKPKVNS